jgi:hypothetical protein
MEQKLVEKTKDVHRSKMERSKAVIQHRVQEKVEEHMNDRIIAVHKKLQAELAKPDSINELDVLGIAREFVQKYEQSSVPKGNWLRKIILTRNILTSNIICRG